MSNEQTDAPTNLGTEDHRGLTRKELYDLVWSEPVQTVAERFGMSDRGLAKLCERHAIPVPGRGYWRRKETGHPVRHLPLPKLHPTHQELATVQLPEAQVVVRPIVRVEAPPDPLRVAAQRVFEAANPILVSDLPDRPHPLVRATRAGLRKLKDGEPERLHATGDASLDLDVTAATRDRGLCIIEALCRAFKQRGWPVAANQGDRRNSQIEVHGVKIAFSLEERLHQRERPQPKPIDRLLGSFSAFHDRHEYIPTGELVLKAWHRSGSKSKWSDGKRQRVEDKLNDFMITVVRIADNEIRCQEERVVYERQRSVEEHLRWERERRQAEEDSRGKDLARFAGEWREAELLSEFIAAAKARMGLVGDMSPDSQLKRWLRWAEYHVERLDPLNRLDQLPPPYLRRGLGDSEVPQWPQIDEALIDQEAALPSDLDNT